MKCGLGIAAQLGTAHVFPLIFILLIWLIFAQVYIRPKCQQIPDILLSPKQFVLAPILAKLNLQFVFSFAKTAKILRFLLWEKINRTHVTLLTYCCCMFRACHAHPTQVWCIACLRLIDEINEAVKEANWLNWGLPCNHVTDWCWCSLAAREWGTRGGVGLKIFCQIFFNEKSPEARHTRASRLQRLHMHWCLFPSLATFACDLGMIIKLM